MREKKCAVAMGANVLNFENVRSMREQEQKNVLARKQRKAINATGTAPEDERTNTANYWGHNGDTDDLDLKVRLSFFKN